MDTVSNVVTCVRLSARIKAIHLPLKHLKTAGDRVKTAGNQMKKVKMLFVAIIIAMFVQEAKAQSMVTEIQWTVQTGTYHGLLVLYPNNQGTFIVNYCLNFTWYRIVQDAVLTNQYDVFGNCTSYINCYNPRTTPYLPYAADNFIVYPNGNMYTQDAAGNWSTLITAYVVPPASWNSKFKEYNYRR